MIWTPWNSFGWRGAPWKGGINVAYRLRAGEESGKYRPGQFVKASYATRYAHKVAAVVTRAEKEERQRRAEEYIDDYEVEWEITSLYEELAG